MSAEALEKRYTDLQARLASLQDATAQLQELIDRLANFNFQPGSVPLAAADDDNVGAELSGEINQILQEQEEDLELLQEEIIDLRPGKLGGGGGRQHDKERLQDGAKRLSVELQSCRKYFRKAQIAAKQNLELARRQERELLWSSFSRPRSGATSPGGGGSGMGDSQTLQQPQQQQQQQLRFKPKKRSEMSKDEQTISASNDVTQTLRQTYDLMASELSRSEFAHKTLQESTAALAQLNESYANLDTLLATSKDLLGTLWKSQKTDTWYLETSFYALGVTIAWLVFRRWLYGPMWWLVWLPLKLIFRTGMGVTSAVSRSGKSAGAGDDLSTAAATDQQLPPGVVMNNHDVPTIRVGGDVVDGQPSEVDDESMIGKVEQIIAESERNGGRLYGDGLEGDDGPEIVLDAGEGLPSSEGVVHDERVRDEL
ncbi:uncharacterized protein B0I36DRAFT_273524 [Microdochium trichocladiopsis]|uniref:Sec20 C-terminal domain-containing protein n=1 Tax=Microdochium trichocladiopsis TaxID=1682393 RepID=A0A9P8Y3J0_9PEZI|nr:uncharacterized protein B0I36DRAFT_273524 [Microdochium trichocladiopsis]KAH7026513.1 hypothetical protein B0I36DRAFT_273524 [Microdochium trichocladiopsis]